MTIEGTHFARGEFAANSDADMVQNDLDVAAVQLAVADAAQITLPHGETVIAIPVTPGETIQLPTDTPDHLLAEIGPQGNLAFVVDGRTIILQGYVEANEQTSRIAVRRRSPGQKSTRFQFPALRQHPFA